MSYSDWFKKNNENLFNRAYNWTERERKEIHTAIEKAWKAGYDEGYTEATLQEDVDMVVDTTYEEIREDLPEECRNYTNLNHQQFCVDMWEADFIITHYRGKFHYEGPAVECFEIQEAMSLTKIKCQFDQLGKNYIIYPAL